jgi:MFS superfamily sulfate permease-like transporter
MAFEPGIFGELLFDAAGIALVSFTSGVLTAKSFARRNRYEVNANQELIAFGASNIVTGLGQGFPVTGADSRTAVNDAMGGKTQLVGIVAAGSMLLILFFLTEPLGFVPTAALSAVIMVSAVGLFDFTELRNLYATSYRELGLSVGTTLGVLILGVLPGVLLAVALSLGWLLAVVSRPHDEVLGRVKGIKGYHDIEEFPEATTIPGLVIYRFNANLVFFNVGFFGERVRATIAAAKDPVEWLLIDASAINVVDLTAFQKIDELRQELAATGVVLAVARAKPSLWKFFNQAWALKQREVRVGYRFDTISTAIRAFENRVKENASGDVMHGKTN